MNHEEILKLHKVATKIFESDLNWEEKYDMIFSENISKKLDFDYCDPDTSEEEDVTAWMRAFDEYVGRFRIFEENLN